jgi:peptidoglycan/xylan/chitin deacetylase (PgdA/CDA1 family)
LAYHNIVPRGERAVGDRSLHLSQDAFADQLDELCDTHAVIGLEEAFDPVTSAAPRAVVTFDDGYLGTLTAGVDELKARGLPATVFVNPGALGWEGFWWDRLADPRTGELSPRVREHALDSLGGRQEEVLAWARSEGIAISVPPEHARPGSAVQLSRSADYLGLWLGSHSWDHSRLPALEKTQIHDQMDRTLHWLKAGFARVSRWISYPYGCQSDSVAAAAARFHRGGLLVSGGAIPARQTPPDPFRTPRVNIPSGVSRSGFVLRLAGWRARG